MLLSVCNYYNFKAAVFKKNWHSELFLWSCYCWFDVVECCLTLQKDTNGVVTLKIIPNQQSRPMACEVSETTAKSFSHPAYFLLQYIYIYIYIFMITIYSSRFTLWFVNMRSNLITYFFVYSVSLIKLRFEVYHGNGKPMKDTGDYLKHQ